MTSKIALFEYIIGAKGVIIKHIGSIWRLTFFVKKQCNTKNELQFQRAECSSHIIRILVLH